MRDDRIATWTSGEPVSPSLAPNSLMMRCFSSTVIDIGASFQNGHGASRDVVQQGPWRMAGECVMSRGWGHIGDLALKEKDHRRRITAQSPMIGRKSICARK